MRRKLVVQKTFLNKFCIDIIIISSVLLSIIFAFIAKVFWTVLYFFVNYILVIIWWFEPKAKTLRLHSKNEFRWQNIWKETINWTINYHTQWWKVFPNLRYCPQLRFVERACESYHVIYTVRGLVISYSRVHSFCVHAIVGLGMQ